MEMRERWREASGGRVDLRIISNGQGGEEDDVLRKMRIGQFQAGTFTLAGLQGLTDAVAALAIPFLMDTQEQLHQVRAAVGPSIEQILLDQGYVLIHWVDMGWMQFFTKDPDPSPDAIRSHTYVHWGEDRSAEIWRAAGFHTGTRLNLPDITVGLQTGLVDAINTAPLVVYGYQWFTQLDYMIDIGWAPLSGATLVDRRAWERIPADLREELLQIGKETGESIGASLVQWEGDAIDAMTSHGLVVVTPSPEIIEEWRQILQGVWPTLRGGLIPEEMFDRACEAAQRVGRG